MDRAKLSIVCLLFVYFLLFVYCVFIVCLLVIVCCEISSVYSKWLAQGESKGERGSLALTDSTWFHLVSQRPIWLYLVSLALLLCDITRHHLI